MRTVSELAKLTGVSVRTLHHYDSIGLLKPTALSGAGYRLYDDAALERLALILLFRELDFPLSTIGRMLDDPHCDRAQALDAQIGLLKLQRDRMDALIFAAEEMKQKGVSNMDFKAFDKRQIRAYEEQAKEKWGNTEAYKEYGQKTGGDGDAVLGSKARGLMALLCEFGKLTGRAPEDAEVQKQVKKLQDYITANYYTCTDEILAGLGQMYAAGGEMTENIDAAGGQGTAAFAAKAIAAYTKKA